MHVTEPLRLLWIENLLALSDNDLQACSGVDSMYILRRSNLVIVRVFLLMFIMIISKRFDLPFFRSFTTFTFLT